jgi:hypothetical protein
VDEQAIRQDERRKIVQEIRDEAHALARAGRTAEAERGGLRPGSPVTPSAALALADWIEIAPL